MSPSFRILLTALLCCSVAPWPGTGEAVTRDEYTKQECATCHITWLDAFRTKDEIVITEAWRPSLFKDTLGVVTSDEMCYSCHDGFVRDSRQRVWEGKGHSVGKKPSDKVVVPSLMPLNQRGEVYCGTCHTPHGVGEQTAELTGSIFLRTENVDSRLCVLCHTSQLEAQGRKNHPVGQLGKEPLPGEIYRLGGRLGSDPRKIICQSCHTPHGKGPLLKPVDDSSLCVMCHQEKYNTQGFLKNGRPLHPVGIVPKEDLSRASVLSQGGRLGKDGRILCLTCHGVHEGFGPAMTLTREPSSFCQECHSKEEEIVSEGRHNLLKTAPLARNADGQTAKESGLCRTCHRAHGWAQVGGPGKDGISALCTGCHREGGAAKEKTIGPISHPVNVAQERILEDTSLRFLENRGKKLVVCTTCHDPHKDQSYGKKGFLGLTSVPTNQFLREEREKLCAQCHDKQLALEGTKHDLRRRLEHEDPSIRERVERWGPCGACHSIHKAKDRYLWSLDPAPGQGPQSSLCASCHRADHCAREKPVARFNHPVGVTCNLAVPDELPLLEAGQGEQKRGEKVMACHTCHDPHQWKPGGGKADPSVEGSPLDSFLRIPNGADSKLCLSCHKDHGEVGGTDHDLLAVREDKEPTDPVFSGLCSGCHLPHGNDPRRELWTWGLSDEGIGSDRACRHCHAPGGPAEKKAIGAGHFTGRITQELRETALPLQVSGSRVEGDVLACSTCHNPHRWSPSVSQGEDAADMGGAPANREGTGRDSFLRMSSGGESMLCLTCHEVKKAVIGTDHDLRLFQGSQGEAFRAAIESSGVCSPCHAPHNVTSKRFLWSRELTTGKDEDEKICFSCHQTGEMAGGKIPARYGHPDVLIPAALQRAHLTLSSDKHETAWGEHTPDSGIHCYVCHDAHEWSLDGSGKGPGRPMEGDAGSSFLWKKSYEHFCNLCHGNQGLYRYLYFHRWNALRHDR